MIAPKLPKCETCHSSADVHLTPRPGQIPGAAHAARWICGSCEYRETHDNAALIARPARAKVPQTEKLW